MEKQVVIDNLDHYGRGIGRIDGHPIFIEDALPGEIVDVDITISKKNYFEGRVVNYIKTNSKRISSECPYFGQCGGCQLMMLPYEEQLSYKSNKVKEILKKFADIPERIISEIIPSINTNYRNKVTLQVDKQIGLYKNNSYDLIPIDSCLIVSKAINNVIDIIKHKILLDNIKQIVIRSSETTNETMVILVGSGKINEQSVIINLKDVCSSIVVSDNHKYRTIYGNDYIHELIGKYKYVISPDAFFQVNTKQAEKLYTKINEYACLTGKETVLDLYCGTGTIGIFVSEKAKHIVGIEINKYAIEDARKNAIINNITNIEFKCGDVKDIISQINTKIDVVIVDPPRSGLDKEAINNLLKIKPTKIIYVSCDPVTLARDLKILKEYYDINEVTPVDMFPQTYHVENVVLLMKK